MFSIISSRLKNVNQRTILMYKNSFISLVIRAVTLGTSFILVPIYLNNLDKQYYGAILTILSLTNYISLFDFGVGKGLRNKLSIALADGQTELANKYLNTGYYYSALFFSGFFLIYLMASPFVDWYAILKMPSTDLRGLNHMMLLIVFTYSMTFILQLILVVFNSLRKNFMGGVIQLLSNTTILACALILKSTGSLSFFSILLASSLSMLTINLATTIYFFSTNKLDLKFDLKLVDKSLKKDILNLGVKYLVLQITSMVIFSSTNILIVQLYGLGDVTTFNIAFKYYGITSFIFSVIIAPFWDACTVAWHQNDKKWIISSMKKSIGFCLLFALINFLQYLIFPFVSIIWLKKEFVISGYLVISIIIYNFILSYNDVFANFLASISKLNTQMFTAILGALLNIPLTIFLAKVLHWDTSAVLLANVFSLLPSTVLTMYQSYKLLYK